SRALGRVDVERRFLPEDRLMQLAQLAAGLDPELVDERRASALVGVEGLGLASRAIESEHELTAKALAQRVLRDQRLQLAGQLRVAAVLQPTFDALFDARDPLV